jgi:hypothetical protein
MFLWIKETISVSVLIHKKQNNLYKTLIRPVLAYGSETWVLSKSDEAILRVFERKILRAIFGPTNDKRGMENKIQ